MCLVKDSLLIGNEDDGKVTEVFQSKTQSEPSDSQVQWVDPLEEEEREKLEAKLRAETQMLRTTQAAKVLNKI